jgi:hypothetical protein
VILLTTIPRASSTINQRERERREGIGVQPKPHAPRSIGQLPASQNFGPPETGVDFGVPTTSKDIFQRPVRAVTDESAFCSLAKYLAGQN